MILYWHHRKCFWNTEQWDWLSKSITLQESALIECDKVEKNSDTEDSERDEWDETQRARAWVDFCHSYSQSITARLTIGVSHSGEKGSNKFESHDGGRNEFDKREAGAEAGAEQMLVLSTFRGELWLRRTIVTGTYIAGSRVAWKLHMAALVQWQQIACDKAWASARAGTRGHHYQVLVPQFNRRKRACSSAWAVTRGPGRISKGRPKEAHRFGGPGHQLETAPCSAVCTPYRVHYKL